MKQFYKKLISLLLLMAITTFGAFSQIVFSEGFESGAIPSGWTQDPSNPATPWSVGSSGVGTVVPQNGNYFLKLFSENFQQPQKIITPFIDVSALNGSVIEFNMASQRFAAGGGRDVLKVYIRTDAAGDWIIARTITQTTNNWEKFTIRTRQYTQEDNIQIAFEWNSSNGKGIALDDIIVKAEPLCTTPTQLAASMITGTGARLNWNAHATSQSYYLKVSTTPIPAANLETTTADTFNGIVYIRPYDISGLSPSTQYYWYVKAICNEAYGDISGWSAQSTFTTACGAAALPFTETFSSWTTTASWFHPCWTRYALGHENGQRPYANTMTGNPNAPVLYFYHSATTIAACFLPQLNANNQNLIMTFDAAMSVGEIFDVVIATDPQNTATWTTIATFNDGTGTATANIKDYDVEIPNYQSNTYIGFNARGSGTYTVNLDNINVNIMSGCPRPTNLNVTMSSNNANVTWNVTGGATSWQVLWGEAGFDIEQETPITVNSPSYQINGLVQGLEYEVYVSAICSDGVTLSRQVKITFKVPYISSLPFFTNFSDNSDNARWEMRNGTNGWVIGTATNNGGTRSMYISNNTSSSNPPNTYTGTTAATSYSYAYRTFDLAGGIYELDFDWKSNGNSAGNDILRVFLVPAGVELEANNAYGMTGTTNNVPSGWIALSGVLNLRTTWQQYSNEFTLPNSAAGLYHLAFFWRNNTTTASQPPAAIDNISLNRIMCPPVTNINASNITTSGVRIGWNSFETGDYEVKYCRFDFNPNTFTPSLPDGGHRPSVPNNFANISGLYASTMYYVYIRQLCSNGYTSEWNALPFIFGTQCNPISVPYTEDFSAYVSGTRPQPLCWNYAIYEEGNVPAGHYYPYVVSVGGDLALNITTHFSTAAGEDTYTITYAALPEFVENVTDLQITFSAKASAAGKRIQVGVMEDPTDYSAFEEVAEYTIGSSDWSVHTTAFGAYTGYGQYIAFKVDGQLNGSITVNLDDITVDFIQTCQPPNELFHSNITFDSVTISWDDLVGGNNDFQVLVSTVDVGRNMALLDMLNPNTIIVDTIVLGANEVRVGGFQPLTTYYYYVRMVCADGVSYWYYISKSFRTACGAVLLPYVEEFNNNGSGAGTMAECWTVSGTGTANLSTTQRVGNFGASLYMTSTGGGGINAATPALNIASFANTQLSFMLLGPNSYSTVQVGVMTDPTDPATFVQIENVTSSVTANVWEEKVVDLSSYTGAGRYVAFRASGFTFYIDNVLIETTPTCPRPIALTVTNFTNNSAQIAWTAGGTETTWVVEYQKAGANWSMPDTVHTPSYPLSGLDALTEYYVRAKAICVEGVDESSWSTSVGFKTACGVITNFPFIEGFEDTTFPPSCWTATNVSGPSVVWTRWTSDGPIGLASASVTWLSGGTQNWLITPLISVPATGVELSFWIKCPTYYSGTTFNVKVSSATTAVADFSSTALLTLADAQITTTWTKYTVNLSAYAGQQIYIGFQVIDNFGLRVMLDDVALDVLSGCPTPVALTVNPAVDSAVLSWNGLTATEWIVEYKKASEANWITINNVTTNTYTINGLDASTAYNVRVRAVCPEEPSRWTDIVNFRTPCGGVSVPYYENFTGWTTGTATAALAEFTAKCWLRYNNNAVAASNPYINASNYSSATNNSPSGTPYLYFSSGNVTNPLTAVLPLFEDDINTLQINFWALREGASSGTFSVGYLINVNNPNTSTNFVAVQTFDPTSATWFDYEVTFASVPAGIKNIALRQNTTSASWYYWVDDIEVSAITTCPRPTALTATNPTTSSVQLSWTAGGTETNWIVEYKKASDVNWTSVPVTTTSYPLGTLDGSTSYSVRVKADCGAEQSRYSNTVNFSTACGAVSAPLFENFSGWTAGSTNWTNQCWKRYDGTSPTTSAIYINASNYSSATGNSPSGTPYLYFGNSTNLLTTTLLPEFNVDVNTMHINFWLLREGTNSGTFSVGYLTDINNVGSFVAAETLDVPNAIWGNHEIILNNIPAGIKNIALRTNKVATNWYYWVDDINIYRPSCSRPDVTFDVLTDETATISWTGNSDSYNVNVYTAGSVDLAQPGDIFSQDSVTSMPINLSGLTPNTSYVLTIQGNCDGELSTWIETINFKTTLPIASVPYFADFEDSANDGDWGLSTSGVNAWAIGDAVSSGGDRSMYISNDNGVSHFYNINSTSYSYAYKPFNLDANEVYDLTFDWRAYGETSNDLLRVFIIPAGVSNITEGNANGMTGATNNTPAGWIDVGGSNPSAINILQFSNNWITQNTEFSVPTSGVYNLAFFWKNNASLGNQQPAAIDNVNLSVVYCKPRVNPITENADGVQISWTGTANSYNVKVYTVTGSDIDLNEEADIFDDIVLPLGGGNFAFISIDAGELTENTRYVFYVQGVCSDGTSNWIAVPFRTRLNSAPMPYCTDFENSADDNGWIISSSGGLNVWAIGNAVNNGGSRSMYISNDGGNSFSYTTNNFSASYAYKVFDIMSGRLYEMSFDWRANGRSNTDYLRVFLVPDNAANRAKLESGNTIDVTATELPQGWISLDDDNRLNLSNTWRTRNVEFQATQGRWFLTFLWVNSGNGGAQQPAAIDNVCVRQVLCIKPAGITLVEVRETEADIIWNPSSAIAYNVKVFNPGNDGDLTQPGDLVNVTVNTDTYTLTGLAPNTTYTVYIQSDCGGTNGVSIWSSMTFTTSVAVEPLPLITDFTGSADNAKWGFASASSGDNKFIIGTEANSGANSLYVSNNGSDYAYTITSASSTYAYRKFNFQTGTQYYISFDWKAQGESNNDYLRAVLIPASQENKEKIEAGNASGVTATTLPTGWIAVDGGVKQLNGNWSNVGRQFTVPTTRDYYFAFVWVNNATLGTQPPAAIRNVSVSAPLTCEYDATTCAGYDYVDEYFTIPASQLINPGVVTRTTTSPINGCYRKINLTVKSGGASAQAATICQGSSINFFGREITTAGTHRHFAFGPNGCDSTVTLTVTVVTSYNHTDAITVKKSDLPITICGNTFPTTTAVGDHIVTCTYQSVAGCDSIVTVTLTVEDEVGIDEIGIEQFGIAPNPIKVGGEVEIDAEFTIQERNGLKVEVITVTGGIVKTFYPDTYPIKVSGFDVSGTYIVRVTTGTNIVRYGKVIVR